MNRICFVLSSHGFGHMARNLPLIQSLALSENIQLLVICAKPQIDWAKANLSTQQLAKIDFIVETTDVGLIVHENSLEVDVTQLNAACSAYLELLPILSYKYAKILKKYGIQLVVNDISPLGILASKLAKLPNVLIGNFTWVEMYREWLSEDIVEAYQEIYRKVAMQISYALHTPELLQYGDQLLNASLSARPVCLKVVKQIKQQFTQPIVFVSAGMSTNLTFQWQVDTLPYQFITTQQVHITGKNVLKLSPESSNTQEYIAASDYVITKAGWGTVAEALLSHKKLALFARDTVYEDRHTIQQLVSEQLAVKVTDENFQDIRMLINKMDQLLPIDTQKYYDSTNEICEQLLALIHSERMK